MKDNKTLISAIAVMITAVLWAVFTTIACVKLDMQKEELKALCAHCEEEWKQCMEGRLQTDLKHGIPVYNIANRIVDDPFPGASIIRYCPLYIVGLGKHNVCFDIQPLYYKIP